MKTGDNENAIKNYRKSLELNSENDNAKQMLKELEKTKQNKRRKNNGCN